MKQRSQRRTLVLSVKGNACLIRWVNVCVQESKGEGDTKVTPPGFAEWHIQIPSTHSTCQSPSESSPLDRKAVAFFQSSESYCTLLREASLPYHTTHTHIPRHRHFVAAVCHGTRCASDNRNATTPAIMIIEISDDRMHARTHARLRADAETGRSTGCVQPEVGDNLLM